MTPKEKAKELYKKFRGVEYESLSQAGFSYWYTYLQYEPAKRRALIAIDEMLKINGSSTHQEFWQEVKKELESF